MMKKSDKSAALFWFGFLNVGILYSHAVTQRTIDVPPEFLEHGSVEKIAACRYANGDPNKQEDWRHFCIKKWLRTLKSVQIFKIKVKKSKTYSGRCSFQGLSNGTTPFQIQSSRTIPLTSCSLHT
jgi:hypothetical protein